MLRVGSLLVLGLVATAVPAVEGSHVRWTLHGLSPDYDLDFSDALEDPEGSWDYGFRLGLDLLGVFDNFAGVDMAMGVGLSVNYAEQADQAVQVRPGIGAIPGLEMDTRLLGAGGRYYVGIIGGSPSFSYEVLPYIGVALQELRWDLDSPSFQQEYTDVDWVWDTGVMLNVTSRFGKHWVMGLSGGLF
jgi:hypothetical protein